MCVRYPLAFQRSLYLRPFEVNACLFRFPLVLSVFMIRGGSTEMMWRYGNRGYLKFRLTILVFIDMI